MAELKPMEDYEVAIPQSQESVETDLVVIYPERKLRKISRLEKVIIGLIILSFASLAVLTIRATTTISRVEDDIKIIQQDISVKTEKVSELEQEKSELSRVDRIQEAAEKAGLEMNDANVRTVRK